MPVTIREAYREDVAAIVRLLAADAIREVAEDLGPPLSPDYKQAYELIAADSQQLLVVAELDGRIVGTFQLTFIRYLMYRGGEVAQIEAVRVAEESRGQGIGERMMLWAINAARDRGCARIQLTTNKARGDARRFYLRLGFTATHEGMKLFLDR